MQFPDIIHNFRQSRTEGRRTLSCKDTVYLKAKRLYSLADITGAWRRHNDVRMCTCRLNQEEQFSV